MQRGTWVTGNYFGGTNFIGYIENVTCDEVTNDELYTININTPHKALIKRTITSFSPLETEIHPDDLPALIDLSLLTMDKEWFEKLSLKRCELSL